MMATPAIVVTGVASEASRTAALVACAAAYLAKPFGASAFVSLVHSMLTTPQQT